MPRAAVEAHDVTPDLPDGLDRRHHAELAGRRLEPRVRRAILGLLAVAVVAALLGAAGQRPHTSTAAGPAARLELRAPKVVRGGLLFQARIEVTAIRAIEHPRLVLDEGWLERLQINTIEPAPASEASRDGRLVLSYDALSPGDVLVVHLQFQVDPTSVGVTDNDVELDDAETPIATVTRRLRRLP